MRERFIKIFRAFRKKLITCACKSALFILYIVEWQVIIENEF